MDFSLEFEIVDYILVGAAAVTGLVHLYKGFNSSFLLLTLAGAGFIGGINIYSIDFYRNLVVLASIPFTLAQFVFYYRYYGFNFGLLGGLDKLVQLVFVLSAIFYLYNNSVSVRNLLE
jgi:hypothetical protein